MIADAHTDAVRSLKSGIPCGRFTVKIASTPQEIEAAFRLRFQIFNEELGEGIPENAATGLDQDEFDPYCDHLLLIADGQVVGTYRLLYGPRRPEKGFYTQTEFDLCGLPLDWNECVELGRGCIAKDYRKQTTLLSLFWALNRYMRLRGAKYLFGCGSLPPMNENDAEATYQALVAAGKVEQTDVRPHPHNDFRGDASKGRIDIPPLVGFYLEFGAKILGRPAYDPIFHCFDTLVLFDMDHLSDWGNELIARFDKRAREANVQGV